jgi:Holliday junction resolvase
MHAKAKGTRREYASKQPLEAAGYTVFRMAGSHGLFNLIGISATDIVLVQVKSRDWPSRAEREAITAFSAPRPCRKLVHRYRDGQRQPDIWEL